MDEVDAGVWYRPRHSLATIIEVLHVSMGKVREMSGNFEIKLCPGIFWKMSGKTDFSLCQGKSTAAI